MPNDSESLKSLCEPDDRESPLRNAIWQQRLAATVLCLVPALALADAIGIRSLPLAQLLTAETFSAPATVVARNTPRVAAQIGARILRIAVQVGDPVARGDLLVQLDCQRFDAQLAVAEARQAQAESAKRFAERQLTRARNLKKNKSISEELLDQRRTELASRQAEQDALSASLDLARIDLSHCLVRSPVDGVVRERLASVGDYANPGTALVALIETAGQEVSVALRNNQLDGFSAADAWFFTGAGQRFPLTLRTIVSASDTLTRTREARLGFPGTRALPGTAGRVIWQGAGNMIAADLLVRREGQLGVFAVTGDKARFVALPDAAEGRPAKIDLPPDVQIISDGRQRLSDGDTIESLPGEAKAP